MRRCWRMASATFQHCRGDTDDRISGRLAHIENMRDCRRTQYSQWVLAVAMLVASHSSATANDDPYDTERLIPPNHFTRGDTAGAVEPPAPLLEVAPDTSSVLNLAQLTDLALRNNPRT